MKRLAVIITHPIQYYVPVFKLISERRKIEIKVFYTWGEESIKPKFDPGFGKEIEWDIPLLEGYSYEFLKNTSKDPGSHHFRGIQNPEAINKISYFSPDALLVYGWAYRSHLSILRYFKGKIPVWFRGDSTLLGEQAGLKKYIRRLFLRYIYEHIDKAFYVGSANKRYFEKHGIDGNDLIFAPHAIDNNRFGTSRSIEVHELRTKLGLAQSDILILYAGKFESVKNPFLLLKAFKHLKKENAHLLLVGNGQLEKDLKMQVKDEKIPRVHFMDFQNQSYIPVVYQACDLFCLPSTSETWGLAVNEVMATGKAVLVSDQVGCAEDLVLAENGLIFKSGDEQDAIDKLSWLCGSKEALNTMGRSSIEIINKWSFEEQARAIEENLMSNGG